MMSAMRNIAILVAFAATAAAFAESPSVASLQGGVLEVSKPAISFFMRIVYPKWNGQAVAGGGFMPDGRGLRQFDFSSAKDNPAAGKADGYLHLADDGRGGANVHYRVTLHAAVKVQQVGLQGSMPADILSGGTLKVDGKVFSVPRVSPRGGNVFHGLARDAEFRDSAGKLIMRLEFPLPSLLTVMGRSKEGPGGYTLRIPLCDVADCPAGTVLERAFRISGPEPFSVIDGAPTMRKAGPDWIPFMPDKDIIAGSACDYSGLRGDVKPCGTYGRVVARGPHFEFEKRPGVPVRFYGANVCFDACYMEHEASDRLVQLLCRAGYNSVRLHHYDRKLTQDSPDATGLDPDRMEKLDWLLAKCYAAGLYVTTDFFIGRLVPRAAVGLPGKGVVEQREFKSLVYSNALLRANFKTYIGNFLGHVNKYTGRRYGDDPGLFAIAFINEGTPGPSSYPVNTDIVNGLADMETALAADLKAYVRNVAKSSVLLSNISSGWSPAAFQMPRAKVYDYVDDHFYVDHPKFPVRNWSPPWRYANVNPVRDPAGRGMPHILFTRLADRPYTITEYNYCAPSRYRMAGTLLAGSAAALQDWSGLWRFEWTMNPADAVTMDYPEPFHATGFNTPGDPLQLVGEGLFAALFLRGDLEPHKRSVVVTISEKKLRVPKTNEVFNVKQTPYVWAGWRAKMGTLLTEGGAPSGAEEWRYPEALHRSAESVAEELPPAQNVCVDHETGAFSVATARTCGLLSEGGRMSAGALAADVSGSPAAVWVISLDGRPLASTRRALLVHATNVESTDIRTSRTVRSLTVFDHGRLPFLMARGTADVSLAVPKDGWTVHALSPGGRRRRMVPYRFDGSGRMRIMCDVAADPAEATYLYELVR